MKRIRYIVLLFILSISVISIEAQVPQLFIIAPEEIVDEPKVPATFLYYDLDGQLSSGFLGIEIRGGFTQSLPKKTYDIEFWEEEDGEESRDMQFGDLREDDDWVLDAMFNEPLRINSFFTHKLWLEMNQLYYQDEEPDAKSGADVMYVEVTINGAYQGIYMLSEQIDRKQLQLKRNEGMEMRGELYKAHDNDDAAFFNNPDEEPDNNSEKWSGYEFKYPSAFIDWGNVEELIDFVANSSNTAFTEGIGERFDINNLMDYFILINAGRLLDNRAKNIHLCRYDKDEPYFLTPWDLDGSWGLLWNGNNAPEIDGILSNNLFDRLIENDVNGFRQNLADRWFELRASLLSIDEIESRLTSLRDYLLDNNIYSREEQFWDYTYEASDLDYTFNWIDGRMAYLDDYFSTITSSNELNLGGEWIISPNPVTSVLKVENHLQLLQRGKIYNLTGEEVFQFESSNDHTIDVGFLSSGTYILEIEGERKLFFKL